MKATAKWKPPVKILVDNIPDGAIMMWTKEAMPNNNWQICDGKNGTNVDLSNQFVMSAGKIATSNGKGDGTIGPYSFGKQGGTNEITLLPENMPNNWPKIHDPGHIHSAEAGMLPGKVAATSDQSFMGYLTTGYGSTGPATPPLNLDNMLSNVGIQEKGSGVQYDNRPLYYALYFIQKIVTSTTATEITETSADLLHAPMGAIMMWSGAAHKIPHGWSLCDNSQGTLDLRNRFIVGAPNRPSSTKPIKPLQTGGQNSLELKIKHMPSGWPSIIDETHNHFAHIHLKYSPVIGVTSPAPDYFLQSGDVNPMDPTNIPIQINTNKTNVSIPDKGQGVAVNNMPVYFPLYYIQKIDTYGQK
ncbi:hypothetical protein [Pseudotenacibaculum haliotis]|uniref:Tail fiber protein n=1 Tax=Pseudotenacibaculum haliotis TaxID=1862138 RepID=A0ABW5LUU6_9FLAO